MSSSPVYWRPDSFDAFPAVVAAISRRDSARLGNNSMLRGADEATLAANRATFARALGFAPERLAFPRLEHGNTVAELGADYDVARRPTADALMTDQPGWLLGVTVADCVAVLLYDPVHHAVAAVHSGWRGSAQNIAAAAVAALTQRYGSRPSDLIAYLSPAPLLEEYEVGHEVSQQFDATYHTPKSTTKDWFDNKAVVRDQLLAAGLRRDQLQSDSRSTLSDPQFHSYRRDGAAAGRMIVAIGLTSQGGTAHE